LEPEFWPVHTLEQAIKMIEEFTGEEPTPEEIEELRQVFDDEEHDSSRPQLSCSESDLTDSVRSD
jgi:hypothetical protein